MSDLLEAVRFVPDAVFIGRFVDLDFVTERFVSADAFAVFLAADFARVDAGFFAELVVFNFAVLARPPDDAVVFFATVVDFVDEAFDADLDVRVVARVVADFVDFEAVIAVVRFTGLFVAGVFRAGDVRVVVFFAFAVVDLFVLARAVEEGFFAFLAAAADFVVFCLAVVVAIFHSEWCRQILHYSRHLPFQTKWYLITRQWQ